jgi:hypothetical protein
MQDACDACEQPWEVLFEWSYTGPEQYCRGHILEAIDTQPGKTLLDFMPDCQHITHRLGARRAHYRSTRELQAVLTGRAVYS